MNVVAIVDRPASTSASPSQTGRILITRLLGTVDTTTGESRGGPLPEALAARYDGGLSVPLAHDRPVVLANFVSTIDGVVAFDGDSSSGGGLVSGFFEPDRLVMGLLRALADVVVIGAGTVRADPAHRWTATHIHPEAADDLALWRERIGLPPTPPTTVVVTGSGDVPTDHPGLSDPSIPAVLLTSRAGAARVAGAGFAPHVDVRLASGSDRVAPADVVDVARDLGARVVLCEGGPHVLGQLLAAGLVDELFLTVAPQLAGRSADARRPALVEGTAFESGSAPWCRLVSVHGVADHLFLRYGLRRQTAATPSEAPRS